MTSLGLSFWTELRDSLLSLILVRTSLGGGWGGRKLCKGRQKDTTFLGLKHVGIALCGWGTLRSCQIRDRKGVQIECRKQPPRVFFAKTSLENK